MMEAESVRTYVLAVDDDGRILTEANQPMSAADASVELERRVLAYASKHGTSQEAAVERVMSDSDNAELVRAYLAVDDLGPNRFDDSGTPAHEANRRARQYMVERRCTYSQAVDAVFADDEDLRLAYAQS